MSVVHKYKLQVALTLHGFTFHTLHDFMKYNLFTNKVHTLHGKKSVK